MWPAQQRDDLPAVGSQTRPDQWQRHVRYEQQVQAAMATGAPALGGGGGGTDIGGGADVGIHPRDVVQGGVEEAAGEGELAADGVAAKGQICGCTARSGHRWPCLAASRANLASGRPDKAAYDWM